VSHVAPPHRLAVLALALVAAVAFTAACSRTSPPPVGPGGSAAQVHVRGVAGYSLDSVTINAGESVTWIWDEGGHTVTSSDMVGGIPGCTPNGLFDSGALSAGATYSTTFTAPGTYAYFCATGSHCATSFESAVVVVN
jgi:plastocyanin